MNFIFEFFLISFSLQFIGFIVLLKIFITNKAYLDGEKTRSMFKHSLIILLIALLFDVVLIIDKIYSCYLIKKFVGS